MRTKTKLKLTNRLTLVVAAAVADLLWLPLTVRAQALSGSTLTVTGSTTLQGNVSITGTGSVLDFYGRSLYMGSVVSGSTLQPGISAIYTDGTSSKFSWIPTRQSHQWRWEYPVSSGSSTPLMTLDPTNGLKVFDTSGNSVVLSPSSMGVSGAATLLTQQAADSRYVSSANFVVDSAMDSNGNPHPSIALSCGTATGAFSFAGIGATASAQGATASGYWSTASAPDATASGAFSNASGLFSTASGAISTASGYCATASGYFSTATGNCSTSGGFMTTAQGFGQTAVGVYNVPQGNPNRWALSDDLFIIGNGTAWIGCTGDFFYDEHGNPLPDVRSNAFVVKKNGDTTVYGTLTVSATNGSTLSTPVGAMMSYSDGINGDGSSVTMQASGPSTTWNWMRATTSGTTVCAMQLDASNRLILTGTAEGNPPQLVLDPNVGAGAINGGNLLTQDVADSRYISIGAGENTYPWETYSGPAVALPFGSATGASAFAGFGATASGFCSYASGCSSTASAYKSVASGIWSTASGYQSTSSGYSSIASGNNSTASGFGSTASGNGSTASGYRSSASGDFSTAAGTQTIASVFGEFVVGQYNLSQGDPINWVPTDELFVIGNGDGSGYQDQNGDWQQSRSNAFVVKKNGDTKVYGSLNVDATSGNTNLITGGGLVVTGTATPVATSTGTGTKIVSGTNQQVLIPEQGDLSMGDFINGTQPVSSGSSSGQ